MIKDYLLTKYMYWSTLHCIVELHCQDSVELSWLDAHAEARSMEGIWCLVGISRSPQSDGESLACCYSLLCSVWVCGSSLFFPERGIAKNFSWCSWWSLLLTWPEAEAWLSLLGSATTAGSCLLSWLYQTGLLMYLWGVCEGVELILPAKLWTEMLISRK
jgi:hypothetical protein